MPLPGETALVLAGAIAGAGKLNISLVILIAATSAIVGDAGGYWIGRKAGRSFMLRFLKLPEHKLDRIHEFFLKYGGKTVFFGRFISILRTYSAIFAGLSRMPYGTFTLFNVSGGIVWAICFGLLGFFFGKSVAGIESLTALTGWIVLILLLVIGATLYLRHRLLQA